jgi:hypothetical protein
MNNETIQLVCIVVIAVSVAVQAIIMLVMFLGITKGLLALKQEVDDMKTSVTPTVEKARVFMEKFKPNVESTVNDLAAFASGLRAQGAEVEATLGEILDKVNKQTDRIDQMLSGTLDSVDKASTFVTQTVGKPVRQLSGIVAGVKAMVESLRSSDGAVRRHATDDDKNMFV